MPGIFVTATGTDVGKTYLAAALIRAGRRAGRDMDALKPVMSGFDPAHAAASDAGVLLAALGEPVTQETIARVSPWRFAAPLSPDMAAAAEGAAIDFDVVVAACRARLSERRLTIVEGVGGVMVPLDRRHTTLDLMAALALPVVLVSATGLGAISHCLTALLALRGRGLAPAVIVLSETPGSTVPLASTRATIEAFVAGVRVATLLRDPPESAFDALLALL